MLTLIDLINKTADYFSARKIENARLNAETLIAQVLKLNRLDLYLQYDRPLESTFVDQIREFVRRRGRREPLQYILGEVDFLNIQLKVDRRALIPRPETEELVDLVINILDHTPGKIVDLGTGCGAIALALAEQYPDSQVLAVDCSDEALSLAHENVERHGLEKRVRLNFSDWFKNINGTFDLIVANPPYLSVTECENSQPEVKDFEPRDALVAREKGLSALKYILSQASDYLNEGGLIALETGIEHHAALREVAAQEGFKSWESRLDIHQRERFFLAWK